MINCKVSKMVADYVKFKLIFLVVIDNLIWLCFHSYERQREARERFR